MKVTPINTFSPPAESSSKNDLTGLFLTVGFVVLGSAALYVTLKNIEYRKDDLVRTDS